MTFLYKYHKLIGQAISYRANIEEWLKSVLNISEIDETNLENIYEYLKNYIKVKSKTTDIKFRVFAYPDSYYNSLYTIIEDIIESAKTKLLEVVNSELDKDSNRLDSRELADFLTDMPNLIKGNITDNVMKRVNERNSNGFASVLSLHMNEEFDLDKLIQFTGCEFYISEDPMELPVAIYDVVPDVLYIERSTTRLKELVTSLDKFIEELDEYERVLKDSNYVIYIDTVKEYLNRIFDVIIESLTDCIEFVVNYLGNFISNDTFITSKYEENVCSVVEYPDNVRNLIGTDEDLYNYINKFKSSEDMLSGANMNFGKRELQSQHMIKPQYAINDIEKKYESKFKKVDSIIIELLKIKPQKLKNKLNAMYFKKWLGRIPGMYNSYGNEARITENRMKGDPTTILSETAPAYLEKTATETNNLFQEIINLSRRITASSDIRQKLNQVKSFCETYKIEDPSNPKEIEKTIKNECLYRICKCIFQGNQIYGYTPEGIVENGKFPTANHIITSLFIENAHEHPEPQSVSQIFSSPESMSTFAFPEKLVNYENLLRKVTSSVSQNFNKKMLSSVHNGLELNFKNYSNSLVRKSSEIDGGDAENAKLNKQLAKSIENGIVSGLDLIIDQKMRVMQCVGCCYDMLGRVQRLAKLCVAALHQVEIQHADSRHQAGVSNIARNATNVRLNRINNANNAGYVQQ